MLPARFRDPLGVLLRRYPDLAYSDRARLKLFVWVQLTLAALALFLLAGGGWGTPVTVPILLADLTFLAGLLVLVGVGRRNWAEGLSSLLLPVLFGLAVANDPRVVPNPLGGDLLMVYTLFCLILITLTTSKARWIVTTGLLFLAVGLWFRLVRQVPFLPPEYQSEALPPTAARLVVIDLLAVAILVGIQRIIRRANSLANEAKADLVEANRALAATVATQGAQLEAALDQVRVAQRTLADGEKLSTVGRLLAGIAHEINTPLAAIESSASNLKNLLKSLGRLLFDGTHAWSSDDFRTVLDILDTADLSGLGTSSHDRRELRKSLPADLPPEVADGLAYWGLTKAEPRWVEYLTSERGPEAFELLAGIVELYRSAAVVTAAAGKATVFVHELRKFMAKDRSQEPALPTSVTGGLETVLLLYQNQLRGRIEVARFYPETDPHVVGQGDRLLQVWSNLISNALGAMGDRGTLELHVREAGDSVEVTIVDSGSGVPDGVRDRIFEPFFSTKQIGDGMGLGLDIVRGIVGEHRGQITFESRPGRTAFTVTLPQATP
jgi:signal transduction histidine kinase